ncbi:hypothetical protein EWD52_23415 [Salmonella enterica subsp. enterica serovar Braenderup]|nr:hypothetical protein [Salmonella enterica subsp. enterica serovar Braenderup]ECD1500248.1 hypothetical protein [Salmonella enterica subsp. enterica serovar Braenderup]
MSILIIWLVVGGLGLVVGFLAARYVDRKGLVVVAPTGWAKVGYSLVSLLFWSLAAWFTIKAMAGALVILLILNVIYATWLAYRMIKNARPLALIR